MSRTYPTERRGAATLHDGVLRLGEPRYIHFMAANSTMLPLGTALPAFELPDTVSGQSVSSSALAGQPLVVAFICNHCPYVVHLREGLADFGKFCAERGVQMIAISSNDVTTHPQDGPGPMREEALRAGYPFAYLYDESQDVARAFQAACTPEFYLFDAEGKLVYRGQFDDSRPQNGKPVTGADLRAAVEAVRAGHAPAADQKPSVGCSIKWRRSS